MKSGRLALVLVLVASLVAVAAAGAAWVAAWWRAPGAGGAPAATLERGHAALAAVGRERAAGLELAARALADEPALREVLAAEVPGEAAAAAADVVAQRRDALGYDLAVILDPAGRVVAAGEGAAVAPGDELGARPPVAAALAEGTGRGPWTAGDELYDAAVVRVAPEFDLLGYVLAARRVDAVLALDLARASGAGVTFALPGGDGPRLVASSLEPGAARELLAGLAADGALRAALGAGAIREAAAQAGGVRRRVLLVPLRPVGGAAVAVAVLSAPRPGAEAWAVPLATTGAALAALLVATLIGWLVARRAAAPVRRLTDLVDAAPREAFTRRLDPTRHGALAPLAAALDRLFRYLEGERSLAAAAAPAGRRPGAATARERKVAVLAVELRRFTPLDDAREAVERRERDVVRVRRATATLGGRLSAGAGHRLYATFAGEDAAWRAVVAGAAALAAMAPAESAFDAADPPALAVASGTVAATAEEAVLIGPAVALADSLLRETASGDLALARTVHREVAGRLAERGVEAVEQRGLLSPQALYVIGAAAAGAVAGEVAGAERPRPGESVAGRYEVLERSAAAGGVSLARVRDAAAGELALKWIAADARREGVLGLDAALERVQRLRHPALASCHDAAPLDDAVFLAREWVDGVDAAALGALPPPALLALARQLAAALAAVHGAGLVHARIKPENLLVEPGGRLRVTDLGVGLVAGPAPSAAAGGDCLAPEQRSGGFGDARSDVYAAGAVLARLASDRAGAEATAAEVSALSAVLARCLETGPEERYADGEELLAALREIEV